MTQENCSLLKRGFSEGPVLMMCQKSEAFKLTINTLYNERLQVQLSG